MTITTGKGKNAVTIKQCDACKKTQAPVLPHLILLGASPNKEEPDTVWDICLDCVPQLQLILGTGTPRPKWNPKG